MLYILYGIDTFRRTEELNRIRARLDTDGNLNNNTVRFDRAEARSLTAPALQSACQSASFFAEGRLVIIEGLQSRFSGSGRRGKKTSTTPTDADAFSAVLTNLPESTTVVLLDESNGDFLQSLQAHATVMQFPHLKGAELRNWAQQRARERGAQFAPAALERLLSLVDGAHLGELANEIDKLGTYALGRTITVQDVDTMASSALQTMAWDILDPVVEGRPDRALRAIQAADEKDFHPMVILAMIRNQFRRLLLAQSLLRDGANEAVVGEKLAMRGFPLQKLIQNSGRFPGERLETAFRLILRADVDVKTGVLPIETVLPALIIELAELQRSPRSNRATAARL